MWLSSLQLVSINRFWFRVLFCFLIFVLCKKGTRAETSTRVNGSDDNEGVGGLKALGVRELTYKMAFLAFHVSPCNAKVTLFPYNLDLNKYLTKNFHSIFYFIFAILSYYVDL